MFKREEEEEEERGEGGEHLTMKYVTIQVKLLVTLRVKNRYKWVTSELHVPHVSYVYHHHLILPEIR